MYRVVVKSSGKYNVAALGARYCFTRKSVVRLATTFMAENCDIDVEKFIRIHDDVFSWTDAEEPKIWDKIEEALNKRED